MREIFEKLLKKPSERKEAVEVTEKEPTKVKITWFYKITTKARIAFSEINPFNAVFVLIIVSFIITFFIGLMLPWMGIISEVPYAVPLIGSILVFALGWEICNHFNKNIRNRVCQVDVEGASFLADNTKIDLYDGGETIYYVDLAGHPVINRDEQSMLRYGKQKNMFVPKNILNQFGSILSRRSKEYPSCKLTSINSGIIDNSMLYIPKRISESRLLKKVELVEENLKVASEIIEQLRDSVISTVSNLRGHESEELKSLITSVSALQETFMSTPTKLQQLLNEQMYKVQGYGRFSRYGSRYPYSPYRSFGYGGSFGGSPNWGEITSSGSEDAAHSDLRRKAEEE